ncbi:T9SS type A sorting domain-containing protein [Dyadobacter sandarakinus]|uniref:T9SS type A sorting domain-containing protein n=1 Tax=Dyadobacter sandarakinus TaxID=2747268 RepID=A0ABX7IBP8_9BACT|nr:T9SS type A sorting domain-containing protein [Dyadobacter sandarakinus]QRR03410.1 T9SS type A sorting domain-containing protein [Dyadobacter sandarakinus]
MKFIVFACLFLKAFSGAVFAQGSLEGDRQALAAIYNANNGDDWFAKNGWNVPGKPGDNPCGWEGVGCTGGRVTTLDVSINNLFGVIPPEIGNLSELRVLNMTGAGAELMPLQGNIPVQLGNLLNLEELYLSGNTFDKENISVIGKLTKLRILEITPYWEIPDAWSGLVNLESCILANLEPLPSSPEISFPKVVYQFTKLKKLVLSGIKYRDGLDSNIGKLVNLEELRLGNMQGQLPAAIGNLAALKVLYARHGNLVGSIPATFGNLTNLELLDLSDNALSGTVPDLTTLAVSATINISDNQFSFAGLPQNLPVLDVYSPQKIFNARIIVPLSGSSGAGGIMEVPNSFRQSGNTYYWFKDNVLQASGQTAEFEYFFAYILNSTYRLEITNSNVPQLRLRSYDYTVQSLPVTLVSFSGRESPSGNLLTWHTAAELDNAGFDIERSRDAKIFEKIGFVDGNGDSEENHHYRYLDQDPSGTTYYRLKQLDHDGSFQYSGTVSVKNAGYGLSIYPNPASSVVTISGHTDTHAVGIYHSNGTAVARKALSSKKTFDISGLPAGLYTLMIGNVPRKLLIQN